MSVHRRDAESRREFYCKTFLIELSFQLLLARIVIPTVSNAEGTNLHLLYQTRHPRRLGGRFQRWILPSRDFAGLRNISTSAASRLPLRFCPCAYDAPTNDLNKGCGSNGFDLNSGWNWHPIKKGCPGISTIST